MYDTENKPNDLVQDSREIRVFLSSTFKDMNAERDALMTQVFPELRRFCAERMVSFTEIDLRWGVTEEASKNGRTVEICLEEIDHCRNHPPFFIGFLGERYGWIPRHDELKEYWKQRGVSVKAPVYAERIEQALDAGIGVTELEMRYGFLDGQATEIQAKVFLRDPQLTEQLAAQGSHSDFYDFIQDTNPPYKDTDARDAVKTEKLHTLKSKIRTLQALIGIDGYSTIESFTEGVKHYLTSEIERLYPLTKASNAAEQNTRSHAIYAQSRLIAYVPNNEINAVIHEKLNNAWAQASPHRLVHVNGASGLGKSALLAYLANSLQNNAWAHSHFIGADGDRSLDGWRERALNALVATGAYQRPEKAPPADQRWEQLGTALGEVQRKLNQPIVLILDALDQLDASNIADELHKLMLPPQTAVLLSSTPEIHLKNAAQVKIRAMNLKQRHKAIHLFTKDKYRKELNQAQTLQIAKAKACCNPLFLRLVLDELRLYALHDTLDDTIKSLLNIEDVASLFTHLLKQINRDFARSGHKTLAHDAARYLALSWRGLHQADLATTLGSANNPDERLPDAILSPLLARLDPFVLRDNGKTRLMHAALLKPLQEEDEQTAGVRQRMVACLNSDMPDHLIERIYQWSKLDDRTGLLSLQGMGTLEQAIVLQRLAPELFNHVFYQLHAHYQPLSEDLAEVAQAWSGALYLREWQNEKRFGDVLAFQNGFPQVSDLGRPLLQDLVRASTAVLGFQHAFVANTRNNLGVLYKEQGHYEAALDEFEYVITIIEQTQGFLSPTLAVSFSNLASVYQILGQFYDALPLFKRALDIRERTLELPHLDIATSLDNLAGWYLNMGEIIEAKASRFDQVQHTKALHEANELYAKALPLLMRALNIRSQKLGLDNMHPSLAHSLHNIAGLYRNQKKFDDALSYQRRSLELSTLTLGSQHPIVATSLNSLAGLYQAKGEYSDAHSYFECALAISEQVLGDKHPDVAMILFNQATLYMVQKNDNEALPKLKRAVTIYEHVLGDEDPKVIAILDAIAVIYQKNEQYKLAVPYLERVVIGLKKTPNTDPLELELKLSNLAAAYFKLKDFEKALPLYEEALTINEHEMGAQHPQTLNLKQIVSFIRDLLATHKNKSN